MALLSSFLVPSPAFSPPHFEMVDGGYEVEASKASTADEKSTQLGSRDELEVTKEVSTEEPEFPDGGFRAWLVIAGVRSCPPDPFVST